MHDYIHRKRVCPVENLSTAGAICPSLYCSVSYPHLAILSSCLQPPHGFLTAEQDYAQDSCFFSTKMMLLREVWNGERRLFAMVICEKYTFHAAKQL